mmetsp:Transcript_68625/g.117817  ORF Transcript_68625/g.117817 Transcript_68625/m.117817 type:complete len:106 (-) Transcript_68625:472-789(-)
MYSLGCIEEYSCSILNLTVSKRTNFVPSQQRTVQSRIPARSKTIILSQAAILIAVKTILKVTLKMTLSTTLKKKVRAWVIPIFCLPPTTSLIDPNLETKDANYLA